MAVSSLYLGVALSGLLAAKSFILSPLTSLTTTITSLSAMPSSSSSGPAGSGNGGPSSSQHWGVTRSNFAVPSKTARESAVNVEWEPMTELERRLEDGIHYEHIPNHYQQSYGASQHAWQQQQRRKRKNTVSDKTSEEDAPSTRAVFCGYRYTEDEYNRLKAAEVME